MVTPVKGSGAGCPAPIQEYKHIDTSSIEDCSDNPSAGLDFGSRLGDAGWKARRYRLPRLRREIPWRPQDWPEAMRREFANWGACVVKAWSVDDLARVLGLTLRAGDRP